MTARHHIAGWSLIELMVAMVIALFILLGVAAVFQSNARVTRTAEALAAMQNATQAAGTTMGRALTTAGFMGCSSSLTANSILNPPTGALNDYTRAIMGYDGNPSGTTLVVNPAATSGTAAVWSPALPASLQGQVAPGSDVVITAGAAPGAQPVVATLITTGASSLDVQNATPFQAGTVAAVSDCAKATAFEVTGVSGLTLTHATGGAAPGNRVSAFSPAYPAGAQVMPLQQTAFFLAPGFDGQPMLDEAVNVAGAWQVNPLLPDVDALRIQYGLDQGGAITAYVPASQVPNWNEVGAVRVALLVAGPPASWTPTTASTTTWNLLDESVQLPNDNRLHHVVLFAFNIRNQTP